jgi:hypothetical protein
MQKQNFQTGVDKLRSLVFDLKEEDTIPVILIVLPCGLAA